MNNNYFFSFFPPHEILFADSYLVAWKRGIAILSAGTVKVTPDPRVRLVNGYSLQIKDAVPQDAGDYVCQIATMEPREITHTVEILGKFFSPPDFLYRFNGCCMRCDNGDTGHVQRFYFVFIFLLLLW